MTEKTVDKTIVKDKANISPIAAKTVVFCIPVGTNAVDIMRGSNIDIRCYGFESTKEMATAILAISSPAMSIAAQGYALGLLQSEENNDKELAKIQKGYCDRNDDLKERIARETGDPGARWVKAWIEKCVDCRFNASCFVALDKAMDGMLGIREAALPTLLPLARERMKEIKAAVEMLSETFGVINEKLLVEAINYGYRYCRESCPHKNAGYPQPLSKLEDLHGRFFGVCSECPQRMILFKAVFDILTAPHMEFIKPYLEKLKAMDADAQQTYITAKLDELIKEAIPWPTRRHTSPKTTQSR